MQKIVAVYVRVSSKTQDTKSQKPDLDQFAKNLPDGTEVRYFSDKFTGKTMGRPAWKKLESAIQRGEVSTVVVWQLDRLGRTAKGLTALFAELSEKRVNLVSLKEGLDLSTPAGRLMANVLASVAQFETEVRAERVIAGQAAARDAGKTWGGSVAGVAKKCTHEQIATIRRMQQEGSSKAAMARATGLSRPTVYSVLSGRVG